MSPRPVQRPHPPLIIGGVSKPAIRRVARFGDGWLIVHDRLETLDALIEQLKRACEKVDRDPAEIELTAFWHTPRDGVDMLEAYRKRGIARAVVNLLGHPSTTPAEALEKIAETAAA